MPKGCRRLRSCLRHAPMAGLQKIERVVILRFLLVLVCVSLILHLAWERAHLGLYTGYEGINGPLPIVLWASAGDVLYTLLAFLLVSFFKRRLHWVADAGRRDYAGLMALGFLIALLVEYKAMFLERWAYAAAMPIIPFFGVGLSPVAQMTLLLPLSVLLAARIVRRAKEKL